METTINQSQWEQVTDGVKRQVVLDGERIMFVKVHFEPGAIGALHSHPHEQATYVIKGRLIFSIDGVTHELVEGQSIHIPSHAVHGVEAVEETILLDTFSPPREDFRK